MLVRRSGVVGLALVAAILAACAAGLGGGEPSTVARVPYDHASVLKLIEWRFGLEPLTERDRRAAAPLEAFDFSQAARGPVALPKAP